MQLYASDVKREVVSAGSAKKQADYACLECGGILRMRGGIHRQNHFYHIHQNFSCRQSGKSMAHLQTQCRLEKLLPGAELEKPFPEVNRIADVVWEREKLVFEVQCSPIDAKEVLERNRDYRSCGYEVVWILHDDRYNKLRVSGMEQALRDHPHYFTNIDSEGKGIIYDQYDRVDDSKRGVKLPPLEVNLSGVRRSISVGHLEIQRRLVNWPVFFEGDLVTRVADGLAEKYLSEIPELKKEHFWWKLFTKSVVKPYRIFFQMLLESCCR